LTTLVSACESSRKEPGGGAAVIAGTSGPNVLLPPFIRTTIEREVTELVFDYLAEVGPSLNTLDDKTFGIRLARSWHWANDSMSLAVDLQPQARWHDGMRVSADDVVYSFLIYTSKQIASPIAEQLARIDSVTARDSLTAVFWFNKRYPLQFYDAMSQMQIIPKHVLEKIPLDSLRDRASSVRVVGTGRYRFVSWKHGESVELAADSTNYRGSPGINRLIFKVFQSAGVAVRALLAGEADIYDGVRPDDLKEIERHPDVNVMISTSSDYVLMVFNERDPHDSHRPHPFFSSKGVRLAMTMAIDRDAITRNLFDSLARPAIGPTVSYFVDADARLKQLPFDPVSAGRILDSLGWRMNDRTGIRTRNGKELRFRILVPTSSANRMKAGVLIQEQLKRAGVDIELDQLDAGTFNSRVSARDFDAVLWGWHLGTDASAIRQTWTTNAINGGNNFGSYSSAAFDAHVDSATTTFDRNSGNAQYLRAYQQAIEDAPAVWLYEPKLVMGIHKRIHTAPSRPDAWWYSLADWYIPSDEQIAQDRVK